MAARPDVRLETAPMAPVTCTACGARVEARKSSWDQTSIQWHDEALARCLERRASEPRSGPGGPSSHVFPGCATLRDSVREAAVRGELQVVDDDPLKSNPEAEERR